MRFLPFALGGLLAATLPAHAQTTPTPAEPAAVPRYYVGLAAYSSYYQPLGRTYGGATRLPVQLTVGYQLRPRLAVQVGLAYSGITSHYDYESYYNPSATGYYHDESATTNRHASVSVLARHTLTRNPAHRMQFDALGGFTLEHSTEYTRGTITDGFTGTLRTYSFSDESARTALLLTAGLSTRYRLGSRVDLNFDFTLNRSLTRPQEAYLGQLGLTGSAALGLRYRFGQR